MSSEFLVVKPRTARARTQNLYLRTLNFKLKTCKWFGVRKSQGFVSELWTPNSRLSFSREDSCGGEASKKDFHRTACPDMSYFILFHLPALVCPHGRLEEHPSFPSPCFHFDPRGLRPPYVFRWPPSHLHNPLEEGYLSLPKAEGCCGKGPLPFYDLDGEAGGGLEGEGSTVLHRAQQSPCSIQQPPDPAEPIIGSSSPLHPGF